ncbi:MAG: hypothetical protein F6K42_34690, partial [Leptolyngbya sp. SIO1D8]|nr:hypothetical protein [Leptolyngbya sp. SIO1D8]
MTVPILTRATKAVVKPIWWASWMAAYLGTELPLTMVPGKGLCNFFMGARVDTLRITRLPLAIPSAS